VILLLFKSIFNTVQLLWSNFIRRDNSSNWCILYCYSIILQLQEHI